MGSVLCCCDTFKMTSFLRPLLSRVRSPSPLESALALLLALTDRRWSDDTEPVPGLAVSSFLELWASTWTGLSSYPSLQRPHLEKHPVRSQLSQPPELKHHTSKGGHTGHSIPVELPAECSHMKNTGHTTLWDAQLLPCALPAQITHIWASKIWMVHYTTVKRDAYLEHPQSLHKICPFVCWNSLVSYWFLMMLQFRKTQQHS